MKKVELRTQQLEDLPRIVQEILALKGKEQILAFSGEMGAGKTTLISAICNALKVQDAISSPTYSLVNEYLRENGEKVYHFDFYRIDSEEEAMDMGVEDYFESGALCLVEWPEKIENLLPENYIHVKISLQKTERIFNLELP
ncbi:MAG: tRNA (adenosine(37)-N6)-threonylcarbamoyltransferase complex ATPase subunit type 1 TsaE [Flavobacteriales bacterium]|nr:tRNA (adenosine(37)-N6)-threonylcarbamoyltransferase complex ATPase subunit type 1 TsaE [Flavobacteriales bacterium]|tara:strand:+ start:15865 stop:16290 length:426 start_codon:yes stop_codon:yes gene_type:complete